jgi:uncharacterized membrane protein YgcG
MRTTRIFSAAALVLAVIAMLASPATAQTPKPTQPKPTHATRPSAGGEFIYAYAVRMAILNNGVLVVQETIAYDFGSTPRHGIERDLVRRESFDSSHDRVYKIDVGKVTTDKDAPVPVQKSNVGNYLRLRIGDPKTTITGVHTYKIFYSVRGALRTFPDHIELNWDAIGHQWPVPIGAAAVQVSAANIQRVACFSGPVGSTAGCNTSSMRKNVANFTQRALPQGSGMTVVVALPPESIVPAPHAMLVKHRTVADAFAVKPLTVGVAGVLALLGIGAVGALAYKRGRDRRYTGSAVDAAMGNTSGQEELMPLGARRAGPVEFIPPEDVRPGEVGTLIDERANLLDVTATIVDLAVRGHLRIAEIPNGRHPDYELSRLDNGKGELRPYEQTLYDSLFASGTTVKLSDLKYKFTSQLSEVKGAMYDDVVKNGWYRVRPDRTRMWWHLLGVAVIVVGIAATVITAIFSSFGLIPLAILLTGIVLLAVGGRLPARTGKGSAMLSRVEGFRRLFDEGEEDTRQRFAEKQGIFSQYLPYAIVFGCTKKWAKAFEGLSADQLGSASWYSGPSNAFGAFAIASALDDFDTRATGTLYASQPSSSSASGFSGGGFSGGGGGGGGGGSW